MEAKNIGRNRIRRRKTGGSEWRPEYKSAVMTWYMFAATVASLHMLSQRLMQHPNDDLLNIEGSKCTFL